MCSLLERSLTESLSAEIRPQWSVVREGRVSGEIPVWNSQLDFCGVQGNLTVECASKYGKISGGFSWKSQDFGTVEINQGNGSCRDIYPRGDEHILRPKYGI